MKHIERRYMRFGRGFGHTQAMLNGAKNTDNVVIVAHTQRFADELAKQCKNARGVGLDRTDMLRGLRLPFLVDHYAIEILLGEQDQRIAQLEEEIALKADYIKRLEAENAVLIKRLWDYEHQASDERIRDEK